MLRKTFQTKIATTRLLLNIPGILLTTVDRLTTVKQNPSSILISVTTVVPLTHTYIVQLERGEKMCGRELYGRS